MKPGRPGEQGSRNPADADAGARATQPGGCPGRPRLSEAHLRRHTASSSRPPPVRGRTQFAAASGSQPHPVRSRLRFAAASGSRTPTPWPLLRATASCVVRGPFGGQPRSFAKAALELNPPDGRLAAWTIAERTNPQPIPSATWCPVFRRSAGAGPGWVIGACATYSATPSAQRCARFPASLIHELPR